MGKGCGGRVRCSPDTGRPDREVEGCGRAVAVACDGCDKRWEQQGGRRVWECVLRGRKAALQDTGALRCSQAVSSTLGMAHAPLACRERPPGQA